MPDSSKAAVVNAALTHMLQQPRFTSRSQPSQDVATKPRRSPKVTDLDWEFFDIYPDEGIDVKEAAKALPKNVLLSDWWVHQLYHYEIEDRHINHKADFTMQGDPRLDRMSFGRAAKGWDVTLKSYRLAVDAKTELHGDEGQSQGLVAKSLASDGHSTMFSV